MPLFCTAPSGREPCPDWILCPFARAGASLDPGISRMDSSAGTPQKHRHLLRFWRAAIIYARRLGMAAAWQHNTPVSRGAAFLADLWSEQQLRVDADEDRLHVAGSCFAEE